jgi:hypothetical protein
MKPDCWDGEHSEFINAKQSVAQGKTLMNPKILVVSSLSGGQECAAGLAKFLGLPVDHADSRKAALGALRHREFAAVVIDDCLAESDPVTAELIWKNSGLAVPLQVNFAIASRERLAREIRAALSRRAQEHALALRSVAGQHDAELKSIVTGLLLQSQLALAAAETGTGLYNRLKLVAELASSLREKLDSPSLDLPRKNAPSLHPVATDNHMSHSPIAHVV